MRENERVFDYVSHANRDHKSWMLRFEVRRGSSREEKRQGDREVKRSRQEGEKERRGEKEWRGKEWESASSRARGQTRHKGDGNRDREGREQARSRAREHEFGEWKGWRRELENTDRNSDKQTVLVW